MVSPIGVANLLSLLHQGADQLSETSAQLEEHLYLDKETSRKGVPRLLQNAVTVSPGVFPNENLFPICGSLKHGAVCY